VSPPPRAGELPLGRLLAETYQLTSVLGRGGMGVVYCASHRRLRRRFAVKVLYPELQSDAAALARFYREAEITSQLGHPHIIEVVDFRHQPPEPPFLVMELLEGEDLGVRVKRRGRLSVDEVAGILRQGCSALAAAHDRGVVHRDLKPGNLFLARRGRRDDYVKILDFGISKALGAEVQLTVDHSLIGTPGYMSPEQATGRGGAVDGRTDVFAMGSLLYFMLAGKAPFTGDSQASTLYRIVHEDPAPLEEERPDLPLGVIAVVASAMAKRVDERCSSMSELWSSFAREAGFASDSWDEPTEDPVAPPPRPLERASEPSTVADRPSGGSPTRRMPEEPRSRRMMLLGVSGLLLCAAAAGIGAWRWLVRRMPDRTPGAALHADARGTPVAGALHVDAGSAARPAPERSSLAAVLDARVPDAGHPPRRGRTRRRARLALPRPEPAAPAQLHVVTTADEQPLWARVSLDGRPLGATPITISPIAPGHHELLVQRAGFLDETTQLVLRPGEKRRVVLKLRVRRGPQ
jgi:serine/threonine protein kinase